MGVPQCRCSEGGFRAVQGKSVKEVRHLISGQPKAVHCSPSSLILHHGRQGQGPKHVQASYQLTVIQAPVCPQDDRSADAASEGREGVHQGEGGGWSQSISQQRYLPSHQLLASRVSTGIVRGRGRSCVHCCSTSGTWSLTAWVSCYLGLV